MSISKLFQLLPRLHLQSKTDLTDSLSTRESSWKERKIIMKRLVKSIVSYFARSFNDCFDRMIEGVETRDAGEIISNFFPILLWTIAFILLGLLLLMVAIDHMHLLIIGGFLAAGLYSGIHKLFEDGETVEELAEEPTMGDYFAVLETLRPAVAEVAQALELAPVYSHTDMAADSEERILSWGKVWRMKYKAPKKSAVAVIDTALCKRIIQAQVKTVLERDNPSGFSAVRYQHGGSFTSVIQIDEIKDGDAYIYIFAVIASDTYFRQKAEWRNRHDVLAIRGDSNDDDF